MIKFATSGRCNVLILGTCTCTGDIGRLSGLVNFGEPYNADH